MIIETFHPGKVKLLYDRFAEKGRLLPEGVQYVNSWIDIELTKCFQVMQCDNLAKLNEWVENWSDLADFEIIPVLTSRQAKEKVISR
jgi:hypothetical protein